MQRGVRLDHRFGLGEEVGHLGRVGRHAAAPAAPATGAPSSRRPIATTAMTSSGTITADSTTLAIICRSEEHTSELQSLMRNSYAVFCFKKKRQRTPSDTR